MRTLADCLSEKHNHLAAVRILAATAVLWAHAWLVTLSHVRTADFFHVFDFTLDFHGVHAFFILSGMLLTRSLLRRPDTLRFVIGRLARYLPTIVVAALIAALVVGPLTTRLTLAEYFGSAAALKSFLAIAALVDVNAALPGVFEDSVKPGVMFTPLWTVHYELVFSVCLAAVTALGLLRMRRLVLAVLVAVLAVNVAWFWDGERYAYLGSPHHLVRFGSTFGIGIALAVFADRIPVSRRLWLAVAASTVLLAYSHVASLAGLLLLTYTILCIGFARVPLMDRLSHLGTWSYGFYVSGLLIEQCFARLYPDWSAVEVFAASFVVATAFGALSWRFIEKPAIAWVDPLTNAVRRRFCGKSQVVGASGRRATERGCKQSAP
jgi:peptidoglycan/LPS O-acetylase OafA/YrhL